MNRRYILDNSSYTKAEIKQTLKECGWTVRGRRKTMWCKGKFRDFSLREAASLEGLDSSENLTEVA